MRGNDTLSRLAGDEFTILLPEVGKEKEDAFKVAKRILDSLDSPFIINDNEIKVTTSIGISIYTNGVVNAKDLLKQADTAMYTAKKRGKNNFQVYKTV
ncbi:diguanylate cyclase domain-containing protein [Bacillus solitudinis]|uniref:diguanylate cyclase domain-containing protein n=1 Tax=Bacillus solitudinis TaxID=2014074 RepID=UPI000C25178B